MQFLSQLEFPFELGTSPQPFLPALTLQHQEARKANEREREHAGRGVSANKQVKMQWRSIPSYN